MTFEVDNSIKCWLVGLWKKELLLLYIRDRMYVCVCEYMYKLS